MHVRPADPTDPAAMLAIYAPIVEHTATSFELVPPTLESYEARVQAYAAGWACLVAEHDGRVLGFAYGSSYRERSAYRWSVETSAYVHPDARHRGVGRSLYEALFPALVDKGYCNAYAGIALPNDPSVALHRSVGFTAIGTFPSVGRKFGTWHDVGWFHRTLRTQPIIDD